MYYLRDSIHGKSKSWTSDCFSDILVKIFRNHTWKRKLELFLRIFGFVLKTSWRLNSLLSMAMFWVLGTLYRWNTRTWVEWSTLHSFASTESGAADAVWCTLDTNTSLVHYSKYQCQRIKYSLSWKILFEEKATFSTPPISHLTNYGEVEQDTWHRANGSIFHLWCCNQQKWLSLSNHID